MCLLPFRSFILSLLVVSASDAPRLGYIAHSHREGTNIPPFHYREAFFPFSLFPCVDRMLRYDSAMSTSKLKLIRIIIAGVDGNAGEALIILHGTTNLILLPFGYRVPIRSRSKPLLGP